MRRKILFLMLIIVCVVNYSVALVSAENSDDALAIKDTILGFLKAANTHDIDSALNNLAADVSFYNEKGEAASGPDAYKTFLKNYSRNFININITDFNMVDLDIGENKARVIAKYNFAALDLGTVEELKIPMQIPVSLVKENGSWKISAFEGKPVLGSTQQGSTQTKAATP
jgi:ketosteroid isomerase-like protein